MPNNSIKIKFSGEAGDGILSAGDLLFEAAAQSGYWASIYKSYPSNIQGGYSQALITISEKQIVSAVSEFDLLFALNEYGFITETTSLRHDCRIFVDDSIQKQPAESKDNRIYDVKISRVPITKLSGSPSSSRKLHSIVALGITIFLLNLPPEKLILLIEKRFRKKQKDIVKLNVEAFESGYRYVSENHSLDKVKLNKPNHDTPRTLLEGNQAIALGSIKAGCTFFASYPITPATSIGDYLSKLLMKNNGFAYQAEDEIAALGAVVGASFTGAKAMTATSGPGLSLMQEFLGYASMTELPTVVVNVQRPGPSTGMPTKHAQEDLLSSVFGAHGESPRIVIAPFNVGDCFTLTVEAFNLAEKYRCPVILLSDGALAMIKETVPQNDLDIQINPVHPETGISSVVNRVAGIEHDEYVIPSDNPRVRSEQVDKRFLKLAGLETENKHLLEWDIDDSGSFDCSIVAWGLTASSTKQALEQLRNKGFKIAALFPKLLFPVCEQAIGKLISLCPRLVVPETNYTGQYGRILRMYTDAKPVPVTLYTGEPFTSEELAGRIEAVITSKKAGADS